MTAVICIGQGTRARVMDMVAKQGWDLIMIRAGAARQVFAPTMDRTIASLMEADAQAIENRASAISATSRPCRISAAGRSSTATRRSRRASSASAPPGITSAAVPWSRASSSAQADVVNMAKVAVLGFRTAKMLFGGADPVGQTIRIGKEAFQVKGVFVEAGITPGGDDWDDRIVIPLTTSSRRLFGRLYLEQIVIQVRDARKLSQTVGQIRKLLRERHQIRPARRTTSSSASPRMSKRRHSPRLPR